MRWTAYVLGFGKPAWILQVYAVQNVFTWLLFAWLMSRVIPQTSPRAPREGSAPPSR
jgi:hypothetical protein